MVRRSQVILRQIPRIGPWVSDDFVSLVQLLGDLKSAPRGETEPGICLPLQGGQVVEKGGRLRSRLLFLGDFSLFSQNLCDDLLNDVDLRRGTIRRDGALDA